MDPSTEILNSAICLADPVNEEIAQASPTCDPNVGTACFTCGQMPCENDGQLPQHCGHSTESTQCASGRLLRCSTVTTAGIDELRTMRL